MKKIIFFGLFCQILSGFNKGSTKDIEPVDDIKTSARVVSYESHGFRSEGPDTSDFNRVIAHSTASVQEDNGRSSMSEYINGMTGGLDLENTFNEFIRPLESEPKNPLGGNSMGAPTIYSFFSYSQLQSNAALKLLEKYKLEQKKVGKQEPASKMLMILNVLSRF